MTTIRWKMFALAALAMVAVAADSPNKPASESIKPEDIAKTYRTMVAMTKKPVYVDPMLAMLCRGANQNDIDEAKKHNGPHAYTQVMIYMNNSAAEAFNHAAKEYPAGAIVVKEKHGMLYAGGPAGRRDQRTLDGVGGMIKRAKGFDPEHGDWEFFYYTDPAKIESGKIASCVNCHASAAGSDHVFGHWKKGEAD